MAGIAGIKREKCYGEVSAMLDLISHRGMSSRKIIEAGGMTLGVCWNEPAFVPYCVSEGSVSVGDTAGPGHYATATVREGAFLFSRDGVGEAPLYRGSGDDGTDVFASEIKALAPGVVEISEVIPGSGINPFSSDVPNPDQDYSGDNNDAAGLAERLRQLLETTVSDSLRTEDTGVWLSGGLDSAAVTAIVSRYTRPVRTFTAGLPGAPDLEYASQAARYLGTDHHEITVSINDLVTLLPDVIWHLESFDPLLVRSSLLNFVAARKASGYVSDIFSGEGADELFAGYTYLSLLPKDSLHEELVSLTGKLHNTALQRVDRCASAFGLTPRLVFTHPLVKEMALAIPADLKIVNDQGKWILRKAVEELLPPEITWRPKAKFWEGGGVNEKLSEIAANAVSDSDFRNERVLPNGWTLSGKEELLYYRIFSDLFGSDLSLEWMGRTESRPPVA
jgi:asparagine synthase (glutamine-hydrolysing)